MKQQYIDKIREACIKANPSILDLKFGCEVIVTGIAKDNPGCEKDIIIDNRIKDECIMTGYYGNVPLIDIEKILGRPIQLADVLLMIDKEHEGCVFVTVSSNGFLKVDGLNRTEQPKWNLTKPLEDQSEETLKFISELLK